MRTVEDLFNNAYTVACAFNDIEAAKLKIILKSQYADRLTSLNVSLIFP